MFANIGWMKNIFETPSPSLCLCIILLSLGLKNCLIHKKSKMYAKFLSLENGIKENDGTLT